MVENHQIQFPNYFADAETNFNKAEFVIFGIPYDKTSSFRTGSAKGPEAIRQATWNFETFDILTKVDFSTLLVHDLGNIEPINHLQVDKMVQKVTSQTQDLLEKQKIPIAIGGEHSISPGIIKAYSNDIHVIVLDAHLDFRQRYENEKNNHACAIRRISDYIPIDQMHVLGVRSTEKTEYEEAIQSGLSFIEAIEIHKKKMEPIIKNVTKKIGDKPVYLSIDIDVIDPSYAPGTGTPEPFGLKPMDILTTFDTLKDSIVGFDVMEVNPLFDHGQTAILAAKIIRYGIEKISLSKKMNRI